MSKTWYARCWVSVSLTLEVFCDHTVTQRLQALLFLTINNAGYRFVKGVEIFLTYKNTSQMFFNLDKIFKVYQRVEIWLNYDLLFTVYMTVFFL